MKQLVFAATIFALSFGLHRTARACEREIVFDHFSVFDAAATVLVVRGREEPAAKSDPAPPAHTWRARIAVEKQLKGTPTKELVIDVPDCCACGGDIRPGYRTIVMLDAHNDFVAGMDGSIYAHDSRLWIDTLASWSKLTSTTERASFLAAAVIAGGDVGAQAAIALAERPELAAALTPEQVARLLKIVRNEDDSLLPLALARLRVPGLIDALHKSHGLLYLEPALAIAASTEFESLTDPAKLADAINKLADLGGPRAAAALDRCERVRNMHLALIQSYARPRVGKDEWLVFAAACRSGKATPMW